ncbi:Coq4 family protein [uncultured Brevundimonas sp.]|uniref:Coq4 family protein n=1 Tax=uncultured Brevundimonas sp. TaxID=213418 RepID=UPI0026325BC8|nr:Coq4 family protein [uncultured Brevundimonas sp.]
MHVTQADKMGFLTESNTAYRRSVSLTRKPVQPRRALAAVRKLIADKDDTEQVFEIMNALAGRSIEWGYRRLLDYPIGGQQAYERNELSEYLENHDNLRELPEGSVGKAYLDFVERQNFSAEGLAMESRKARDTEIEAAHPHAWYARRLRDIHDIWHVLTGYQADALGEGCLVAFSLPQTRSKGFGVIAAAVAIQFARARTGHPCARSIWQAWRDGRKAHWLPALDYKALFEMPLEEARRMLNIPEPRLYNSVPTHLRNAYLGAKTM